MLPVAGGARRAEPDPDEEDDEPESRAKWWIIGAIAVLLLAGIAFAIFKATESPAPPAQVAVPDVSGKTVEAATRALESEKFVVASQTEEQASNEVDEGLRHRDRPAGGRERRQGQHQSR